MWTFWSGRSTTVLERTLLWSGVIKTHAVFVKTHCVFWSSCIETHYVFEAVSAKAFVDVGALSEGPPTLVLQSACTRNTAKANRKSSCVKRRSNMAK